MPSKKRSDQGTRPPAAKRPVGRPPKMVVKIDDTPENVAKSMFGIKSGQTRQKGKHMTSETTTRRPPINLEMIGVPVGATLTFWNQNDITCTVGRTESAASCL